MSEDDKANEHTYQREEFNESFDFSVVFKDEMEEIRERREKANIDLTGFDEDRKKNKEPLSEKDREALSESLVGLALSGGGIRSATFCLGLLQGMEKNGLLRIFDYISTVSGGGYVGGWWSAWLSRHERKNQESIFPPSERNCLDRAAYRSRQRGKTTHATQIGVDKPEGAESAGGDPTHHLRSFANYLTPRKGMLSQDTWRAIAVITRNLVMTWLILLPIIVGLVLAGQLYFVMHPQPSRNFIFYPDHREDSRVLEIFAEDVWNKRLQERKREIERSFKPSLTSQSPQDKDSLEQAMKVAWKPIKQELESGKQDSIKSFKSLNGQKAFHKERLADRLRFIAEPLIAIAGWIALMVITWLLLTLRMEKESGKIVIVASLLAVIAIVLCGLFAYQKQYEEVGNWLLDSEDRGWKTLWLIIAVALWLYAWRPWAKDNAREKAKTGHGCELEKQWSNDAWRSRITFVHTRLLMLFVVTAIVLAIAGFGHEVIKYPYIDEAKNSIGLMITLGAIVVLMIIAAYKATPMGGGDKSETGAPSAMTQIILAITPWLMVLVIAFVAAWVGHGVVTNMWERHLLEEELYRLQLIENMPDILQLIDNKPNILPYVKYASFFGIGLCFILAIFEMRWESSRSSGRLYASIALPSVTALFAFGKLSDGHTELLNFLALALCGLGAFFILRDIKRHARQSTLRDKIEQPHLSAEPVAAHNESAQDDKSQLPSFSQRIWGKVTGSASLSQIVFRTMIFSLYLYCFSYAIGPIHLWNFAIPPSRNKFFAMTIMFAATLTGACILYRLIVVRNKKNPQEFKLAIFNKTAKKGGKSPLRIAAAICCLLAIAASCAIQAHNFSILEESNPKSFIETVASLRETHFILENLWEPMIRKIYLPFLALPFAAFLIAAGVFLCAKIARLRKQKDVKNLVYLVFFTVACFALASYALWMAVKVIHQSDAIYQELAEHFERLPGLLKSTTFAGIALCLAFTRFEMKWGTHNNRRSIWLLSLAYLMVIAVLAHGLIPTHTHYRYEYSFGVFGLLVAVLTWLLGLGWLANPNAFSMHGFYKWRLVRAYLGASNENRNRLDKDITETAAGDDVLLKDLSNCKWGAPYHLINTTLNLVAGRDLAIAQRSADTFLLSKKYCGSLRTNYCKTEKYMGERLSLGTAVAVSGAAASPNMGTRTPTSALAMLMTLLNVRLGYWVPTPGKEDWKSARPRLWPFYLIREFFSQTNDLSNYCYLTDGGHFDNTGLYSLVERGCRFIIVADCGADPHLSFGDLGDVIRRCRIDFGAEIELDIKDFVMRKRKPAGQLVPRHFIAGRILYSEEHLQRTLYSDEQLERMRNCDDPAQKPKRIPKEKREGRIIIFKPSLTLDDKADIRQYALENRVFPHTTTTNQWFDESQFESYRYLGEISAQSLFSKYPMSKGGKPVEHNSKQNGNAAESKMTIKQISRLFDEAYKACSQTSVQKSKAKQPLNKQLSPSM